MGSFRILRRNLPSSCRRTGAAPEEALRKHPEIAEMSWQEQEVVLQSLERLHELRNVPVSVKNSDELYRHYLKEERQPAAPAFVPKSKEVEADFFNDPNHACPN
jgi:hypothetical protein